MHSPEISAAGPSSASWSTVNQFFPLNCESTPILRRIESVRSTDSDLPPPAVRLEEIFEENEEDLDTFDTEAVLTAGEKLSDTEVLTATTELEFFRYNIRISCRCAISRL